MNITTQNGQRTRRDDPQNKESQWMKKNGQPDLYRDG